MTKIDPRKVFEELKANASSRKIKSLNLIYELLEAQAQKGEMDFSIATIGRLSSKAGGPSPQAIRNRGGAAYRTLIEVYAANHNTTCKKTLSKGSRNIVPSRDEDILSRIDDPALRAVVGAIIRERNQYRNELRVLKSQTTITIDRRPVKIPIQQTLEVLPPMVGLLTPSERDALDHAISENLFNQRNWQQLKNGRVKDENGRHLYKPGYITAIKKVLAETNEG
jgi:hypothetical protein